MTLTRILLPASVLLCFKPTGGATVALAAVATVALPSGGLPLSPSSGTENLLAFAIVLILPLLAAEMMKIRPEVPIVLNSGYSNKTLEEKCRQLGIRELCQKPMEIQRLVKLIRTILDPPSHDQF